MLPCCPLGASHTLLVQIRTRFTDGQALLCACARQWRQGKAECSKTVLVFGLQAATDFGISRVLQE
jgi:hypothetical protein